MKFFLGTLVFILLSNFLFAQTQYDEAKIIQASFGLEKKKIVESFVNPEESFKEAFWRLYDEYEQKRQVYGAEKVKLLAEYAQKWQELKPEEADKMILEFIRLNKKTDHLIEVYYKKIKKATSIETAAGFYQVETYIRATIHFYVKNTIPFVYPN